MATAIRDPRKSTYKLLLVGKVGQGKSSLGNFILWDKTFEANVGLASITGEAKYGVVDYEGTSLYIVDTPGLADTEDILSDEDALMEIARGLKLVVEDGRPGVDAVLFVVSVAERFGNDQAKILNYFENSSEFWPYVIVVFTNADRLANSTNEQQSKFEQMLKHPRSPEKLKWLIRSVTPRYMIINTQENCPYYYKEQMEIVMSFIREISLKQNGACYTNDLFIRSQVLLMKAKREKNKSEAEIMKEIADNLTKQVSEMYYGRMAIKALGFGLNVGNKLGSIAKRGHLPETQKEKEVKNAGESQQQDSNDSCFPGDSYVLTEQNQKVLIADVVPGTKVFSFVNSNGKMESSEVYTILHFEPNRIARYLILKTQSGDTLKISPNHLIFLEKLEVKFASEVKISDVLITANGDKSMVVDISYMMQRGVFAPVTHSGTIIVDGILVSCYASFPNHHVAHLATAPLRGYYSICKKHQMPDEGVNIYASILKLFVERVYKF